MSLFAPGSIDAADDPTSEVYSINEQIEWWEKLPRPTHDTLLDGLLRWWATNNAGVQEHCPSIASSLISTLVVTATSVQAGRTWGIAQNLLGPRNNRLSDDTFRMLLFLAVNKDIV